MERAHTPQRRCLGCGARVPQADLARFTLVGHEDGTVHLQRDRGQRAPGRGLYVCHTRDCFDAAVLRRAFQRAGRSRTGVVVAEQLGDDIERR